MMDFHTADRDGDGDPDAYEDFMGTDHDDPDDYSDYDEDGIGDGKETADGTDPN